MSKKLTELGQVTTLEEDDLLYAVDISLGTGGSKKIEVADLRTVLSAKISYKDPARLATTGNINLASAPASIDSVAPSIGDRIVVKEQADQKENGIYDYNGAASAMTRSSDADTGAELQSAHIWIDEGTVNADTSFYQTSDNITIGVTNIVWVQSSGLGQITAGDGLTKLGNVLNVVANADGSIIANANDIQVGILATDAQHGVRGGGTQHAAVIAAGAAGFMIGTDKTKLDGISAGAEINTASNVGVGGIGLFKQKAVFDLEFRNIAPGSSKISVVLDGGNNEVDIDVVEGNITHNNLGSIGVDDHHNQIHKDEHISGGGDAFITTDILEAVVKRLQTTTGPAVLLVGAIADGEFLKRSGTSIISAAASMGGDFANGGEAGGADRTLGNTDAFAMGFLTNNVNHLGIASDGRIKFPANAIGAAGTDSDFVFEGNIVAAVVMTVRLSTGALTSVQEWVDSSNTLLAAVQLDGQITSGADPTVNSTTGSALLPDGTIVIRDAAVSTTKNGIFSIVSGGNMIQVNRTLIILDGATNTLIRGSTSTLAAKIEVFDSAKGMQIALRDNLFKVIDFNAGADVFIVDTSNDGDITILPMGAGNIVFNFTQDVVSAQTLIIQGNDRTTAVDDDEAYISLNLDNSAGATAEFARIAWVAEDVTAASKDGKLAFSVMIDNVLTEVVTIDGLPGGQLNYLGNGTLAFAASVLTITHATNTIIKAALDTWVNSAAGDVLLRIALDTKLIIKNDGKIGIGISAPTGFTHIDQSSLTAAIPVLTLDQADVSEEMMEFLSTIGVGNAIEAVGAKTLTPTHFIKVTIQGGLTRYFQVGTIA